MFKKFNQFILTLAFFVLIISPLGLFIYNNFILNNVEEVNVIEKRNLNPLPEFSLKNIENIPKEFEDYFNDHIAYRQELINYNKDIKFKNFQMVEGDVIAGKDDFMFFAPKMKGNPIDDYQGKSFYTDEQLVEIKNNLIEARDIFEKYNKEFVLFFAPNKNRIYPEYMPDVYGAPSENYKLKQVVDYLKNNTDLRIVYPYEELMAAKEKLPGKLLYHKYDTHWNKLGGYIGTRALLKELGIILPDIDSKDIEIKEVQGNMADLAFMSGLEYLQDRDIDYEIKYKGQNVFELLKDDDDSEFIYRVNDAGVKSKVDERKLYMVRDSFCGMMKDYLAENFRESCLQTYRVYDQNLIWNFNADVVVFETLERTLIRLDYYKVIDVY